MKNQQVSQQRLFIWLIVTTCIILATTTKHQNLNKGLDLWCPGDVGVGFPVSFLCDYSHYGVSPTGSLGQVDSADYPYISLKGLLIDGPSYLIIVFIIAWAVHLYYDKNLLQFELYKEMNLTTIIYAIGFLCRSFIVRPNQKSLYRYADFNLGVLAEPLPSPDDFSFSNLLIGSLLGLTIAFGIAWAVHLYYLKNLPQFEPHKQIRLITVTFALGFLFAAFITNSNYENFVTYIYSQPQPIMVPSPTTVPSLSPFETMSPGTTPIATPTH